MHSCIGISLLCVSFQCCDFSSVGLTLAVVASQFGWTMWTAGALACDTFFPVAITALVLRTVPTVKMWLYTAVSEVYLCAYMYERSFARLWYMYSVNVEHCGVSLSEQCKTSPVFFFFFFTRLQHAGHASRGCLASCWPLLALNTLLSLSCIALTQIGEASKSHFAWQIHCQLFNCQPPFAFCK